MIKVRFIDGFSKQGKRENNEDYILYNEVNNPESRFIILCDGMGGHGHGEIASQTVANSVFEYLKSLAKNQYDAQDLQDALNASISTLESVDIYHDQKSMGTTLVVVVVNRMNVLVGHVGDSRCYLFDENGLIKFRTKDHSRVAEAVEAEILTEEDAFSSSYKNILTRCVMSGKRDVKIDVDSLQIENNDRLLLCSDGVNDAMRDREIEESMINRNATSALDVINSICSEKSNDNYSAVIVDFLQDEPNAIVDKSTEQFSEKNSEDVQFLECIHCGEKNEHYAKYCRKCGIELNSITQPYYIQSEEETKNRANLFKGFIKKIFPILYFFMGCLLSTVYFKISHYQTEKEQKRIDAKTQAKDMYMRQKFEEASISFISNLCVIDTTEERVDSVIYKGTLKNKYLNFCRQYKDNGNDEL